MVLDFRAAAFSLNALSAKAFGESEFWLSGIKIIVILLFIILGGGAMFGLIDLKDGQAAPFFSNLIGDGIFPNGFGAIFITMITVNFAFQGTELIGIAAGKAKIRKNGAPLHQTDGLADTGVFRPVRICTGGIDSMGKSGGC